MIKTTFEQLAAFVAVAEREHLSQAAAALGLSPSAVSASIKALEGNHDVKLFSRVGRGIELTAEGRLFLPEARKALARLHGAEQVLNEFQGLARGELDIQASQTIANYWLPDRLMRFRARYPNIDIRLAVGNTATVTKAVLSGAAELGFIEGDIDEPALNCAPVTVDRLIVVVSAKHALAQRPGPLAAPDLQALRWVLRECGSGTRAVFESSVMDHGVDPAALDVTLTLPSNEAVLSAVRASACATALSDCVVAPFIANGELAALDFPLKPRAFMRLRHKERHLSSASREFERFCREPSEAVTGA